MNETMYTQFDRCTICGGAYAPVPGYDRFYLVKCGSCGLVFTQRIPTLQELLDCYGLYPRDNAISPITLKRCNQLLDTFEKFRKNNRLIDVGAGDGWFLHEAAKRGWEVNGTEFEDRAIDNCRAKGIRMHKGVLDPANYPEGWFDIVTSFEVVEHINNPREEFSHFNRILRTGGLVYVTTPNFNALSRDLLKDKWNVMHYPEHLTYYTPATLSKAFLDAGFTRQRAVTAGFSYSRFTASRQAEPGHTAEAPKWTDEKIREMTEENPLGKTAKWMVNAGLNFLGKGDGIKAEFVKR